jgi:cysteine desulfuration protein SufE
MDEIRAEQEAILEEFHGMGDSFSCYSYLLALAALLPPCPEEVKVPENAVKGCQSHVWLHPWAEEGRFRFLADSDTYILKGLLYLLMNVLDGRSLEAAAGAELYFWKDPMLLGSFDDHRQKGIGYVAAALQRRAGELLKNDPTGGSLPE